VIFVHLLDPAGDLVAQHDGEPANGTRPAWSWQPGDVVQDDRALLIPADAPPGEYVLRMGMYNRDTAERRLTLDGEDGVTLGRVRID
jgi:hypothetical protein